MKLWNDLVNELVDETLITREIVVHDCYGIAEHLIRLRPEREQRRLMRKLNKVMDK